jgi:hypothetical protein
MPVNRLAVAHSWTKSAFSHTKYEAAKIHSPVPAPKSVSTLVLVGFLRLQIGGGFPAGPALRRHMFISWSKLSSETPFFGVLDIFSCRTVNTL